MSNKSIFPVEYAFLEKVNASNGKINLKRIMLEELRYSLILYSAYIALDSIVCAIVDREEGIKWLHFFKWTAGITGFRFGGKIVDQKWFDAKIRKEKADLLLEDLSLKLNNKFNTDTDLESLRQAKVNKVEYKFDRQNFPPIIQHKYILIPSNDELQNVGNTCIHQEHRLGTKKYILSLDKPKTK